MSVLNIRVKHNIATYDIQLPVEAAVGDLAARVVELTGVPVSGQKLIFCGKQLPKDVTVPLSQAGIEPGAGNKVMVLGKKFDPMSDENFKQLVTVENKANSLENKVIEMANEITDIDNGHLDKKLHQEAFKSLQKRGKCLNEELQKMLESLDAVQLLEDQLEAKVKRKSIATLINKIMDRNDLNLDKIKSLMG